MSRSYAIKTYVVQSTDGKVLAVKLTRGAAQAVAKANAPASTEMYMADKNPDLDHELCK